MTENDLELHREKPPRTFTEFVNNMKRILDELSQGYALNTTPVDQKHAEKTSQVGQEHAEYMNHDDEARSSFIARALETARKNAMDEIPASFQKLFRGGAEFDALQGQKDSMMSEAEDRSGGQGAQSQIASSDHTQRLDLTATLRAQVDIVRSGRPIIPYNAILKQMKQMTIEILLGRIEIARVYKRWDEMASLAVIAIEESKLLRSKSFIATGSLQHGIALFNMKLYWEAGKSFEGCQKWTGNKEESTVAEKWLTRVYQAQTTAESAVSRRSSLFGFDHLRSRTGTDSVPVSPGALRHELDFASDFDSVWGFGSRASSVASLPMENSGSPQERKSISFDRGSQPLSPRLRDRDSARRAFPEQSPLSPHRTPTTPRISSPLAPRKTFLEEIQSEINKQPNRIPTRTASVGYKPPSRQQDQSRSNKPGRTMSVDERSLSALRMKSQWSYRRQSVSKQPGQLRERLLDQQARLGELRRKSELIGIDDFEAYWKTSKVRRPSTVADAIQTSQKSDRSCEKSDVGSLRDMKAGNKSLRPTDLQAELDRVESRTTSPSNEDASPEEPPKRSFNQELVKPLTALSPDDELPFHGRGGRRKTWAELPALEYDDFKDQNTESEDASSGTGTEPNRYEVSLAEELEREDNIKDSDSVQAPVESTAGTPSKQSQPMDSDSKMGDKEPSVGEALVEKYGADDLYGIEEGYVPPSARSASKPPTPVTATEEDLDDLYGIEDGYVPPSARSAGDIPTESPKEKKGEQGGS